MTEERILMVTDEEMWAIHHARLAVEGPVRDLMEKWLTRNGWFFEKLKSIPNEPSLDRVTTTTNDDYPVYGVIK